MIFVCSTSRVQGKELLFRQNEKSRFMASAEGKGEKQIMSEIRLQAQQARSRSFPKFWVKRQETGVIEQKSAGR